MESVLEQLQPLLSERGMLRNPATISKLIEWVNLSIPILQRKEHYQVVITRIVLYQSALKQIHGNADKQVEVGGTLLDFIDGVMARERMGTIGMIMDFNRHPEALAPGEWLDDGEMIVECPKCHKPAIMQPIPGETIYMHQARVMPHGYDSLDHCTIEND
jgi:hypothetical protein